MVRLWSWEAIAHGAEVVSYFRWRQAPFAQEQHHAGLLRPDSEAAPGLTEAEAVAREITELGPQAQIRAPVALLFDYAADWVISTQPQGADFSYFDLVLDAYRALRRAGLSIDICAPGEDLAGYKLVLAPGLAVMSDTLKAQIAVSEATVILGPRAGAKTAEGAIPVPLPPGLPGIDARVSRLESLPPGAAQPLVTGGAFHRWFEHLEGAATVIITTEDGRPALVAAGEMNYLAGWPDHAAWDGILASLLPDAGLTPEMLPEGLRIRDTATHRFAFNYNAHTVHWNGHRLEPAGVAWWPRKATP
jgi:beta-galactosidase